MFTNNKYRQIWQTALLPVVDFVAVFIGVIVVYLIRYSWFQDSFLGEKQFSFSSYVELNFLISLGVVVIYSILGLYEIYVKRGVWQTVMKLGLGILFVLLSIITYLFFNEYNTELLPQGVPISRFVLGTGGFFAFYFVLLGRITVWTIKVILGQASILRKRIVVISDLENLMDGMIMNQFLNVEIVRYSRLDKETVELLKEEIAKHQIQEIYLFSQQQDYEFELALWAERYNVDFVISPQGFANFEVFGFRPVSIKNKLFLELKHTNLDGWQVVIKRLFDIVFALVFVILFSWLYLIIAIAIKLDSKGPIFYISKRIGPDGKPFNVFKFRRLKQEFCTTEDNLEAMKVEENLIKEKDHRRDGILYKISNDPRSTRVGRFIERTSLDEIPQFFNVILGTMSIVGPRPHQPREVSKYKNHHYKVLNIQPGITGLAQIHGRSDIVFEDEVKFDIHYIENWSFWLDIWIIIKTPFIILFNRHRG